MVEVLEAEIETLFDKTKLQVDFERFDAKNPQVWQLFVKMAERAIDNGFEHYSAKTIFEVMRWQCDIKTTDFDFKLNNNYTAYYARKFRNIYPLYGDFFETRKIK